MGALGCPWLIGGRYRAHKPPGYTGGPIAVPPDKPATNGLGAGKVASIIVNDIRAALASAVDHVRNDVGGATTMLTDEIGVGATRVVRTLRLEAGMVRAGLGAIVGNGAS